MRRAQPLLICWILCARASFAQQPPVTTLRIATVAPDGTEWAREARAFAREVETVTAGAVKLKWYFGALAGDEMSQLDRLKRGQLDGIAGTAYCERFAPALAALDVVGMISRDEDAARILK